MSLDAYRRAFAQAALVLTPRSVALEQMLESARAHDLNVYGANESAYTFTPRCAVTVEDRVLVVELVECLVKLGAERQRLLTPIKEHEIPVQCSALFRQLKAVQAMASDTWPLFQFMFDQVRVELEEQQVHADDYSRLSGDFLLTQLCSAGQVIESLAEEGRQVVDKMTPHAAALARDFLGPGPSRQPPGADSRPAQAQRAGGSPTNQRRLALAETSASLPARSKPSTGGRQTGSAKASSPAVADPPGASGIQPWADRLRRIQEKCSQWYNAMSGIADAPGGPIKQIPDALEHKNAMAWLGQVDARSFGSSDADALMAQLGRMAHAVGHAVDRHWSTVQRHWLRNADKSLAQFEGWTGRLERLVDATVPITEAARLLNDELPASFGGSAARSKLIEQASSELSSARQRLAHLRRRISASSGVRVAAKLPASQAADPDVKRPRAARVPDAHSAPNRNSQLIPPPTAQPPARRVRWAPAADAAISRTIGAILKQVEQLRDQYRSRLDVVSRGDRLTGERFQVFLDSIESRIAECRDTVEQIPRERADGRDVKRREAEALRSMASELIGGFNSVIDSENFTLMGYRAFGVHRDMLLTLESFASTLHTVINSIEAETRRLLGDSDDIGGIIGSLGPIRAEISTQIQASDLERGVYLSRLGRNIEQHNKRAVDWAGLKPGNRLPVYLLTGSIGDRAEVRVLIGTPSDELAELTSSMTPAGSLVVTGSVKNAGAARDSYRLRLEADGLERSHQLAVLNVVNEASGRETFLG